MKHNIRRIEPYTPHWHKLMRDVAETYAPEIYPCGTCGHPVVSGYCCNTCQSANPRAESDIRVGNLIRAKKETT